MVREYTLQGLTCANCAAKIERSVQGMSGVMSASLNLMTQSLRMEISEEIAAGLHGAVERIVHRYEPDVGVFEKSKASGSLSYTERDSMGEASADGQAQAHTHAHDHSHSSHSVRYLVIGAVAFVIGMIMEYGFHIEGIPNIAVFGISYVILGSSVLRRAGQNIIRGIIFDENFLMSLATIGAIFLGDYGEAAGVMLFYKTGEYFQNLAVQRSRKSIAELMDLRPDFANVLRGDELIRVAPEAVAIGETILIKPGERIPLDGVVIEGESFLDTAALTGESVPRRASEGLPVLSGCVNGEGLLSVRVTHIFGESTASRIIDLVENAAAKKAPTENFITTFARYYTPVVVALAALIAIVPPLLLEGMWSDWLRRGLIFLVISCPCALVLSIPQLLRGYWSCFKAGNTGERQQLSGSVEQLGYSRFR